MQNQILPPRRESLFKGFISFSGAALGAFVLALTLTYFAVTTALGWSVTEAARTCFHFPERAVIPEREDIIQMILSAAFFGSDALYFDEGEENTGLTEPYIPPSDSDTPHRPIGEPQTALEKIIYKFDRTLVPKGQSPIVPFDLTYGAKVGEILFTNTTPYEVNAEEALAAEYPIKTSLTTHSKGEPLILIIHTHGTESYSPSGAIYTSPSAPQRSADTSENVVSVGRVMAELLNDAGIPTLHIETMHDLNSYPRAYDLAADTVQKYLTEYPSIKYVFDVHRDAIVRSNGDLIRPVTVINGEAVAQVMLLVGTDELGADHASWRDNLSVAVQLQKRLADNYNRFARPINVRGASFNEQFTKGSLLIEVGSAANSLKEAQNAAKYLTYSIIDMIKDFEIK